MGSVCADAWRPRRPPPATTATFEIMNVASRPDRRRRRHRPHRPARATTASACDSRAIERATRLRSAAGACSCGAAALMALLPLGLHAHLAAARFAIAQVCFELRAVGLGELSVEIGIDEARDPGAAECFLAAHDALRSSSFFFGNSITSRRLHDALSYGIITQRLLQQPAPAMQSAHHRADGAVHDVGDLLVREVLEVAQHDRHPVVVAAPLRARA